MTLAVEVNDGREGGEELYELTQAAASALSRGAPRRPRPEAPFFSWCRHGHWPRRCTTFCRSTTPMAGSSASTGSSGPVND